MLFHLLYPFRTQLSVLNVTRYITFRTAAASLSALAISLALGPWMVRKLREFQIGQVIRTEGPTTHKPKAGTPTMGGLLILLSLLVSVFLWSNLDERGVWILVGLTVGYGVLGFIDDYGLEAGTSDHPTDCERGEKRQRDVKFRETSLPAHGAPIRRPAHWARTKQKISNAGRVFPSGTVLISCFLKPSALAALTT